MPRQSERVVVQVKPDKSKTCRLLERAKALNLLRYEKNTQTNKRQDEQRRGVCAKGSEQSQGSVLTERRTGLRSLVAWGRGNAPNKIQEDL